MQATLKLIGEDLRWGGGGSLGVWFGQARKTDLTDIWPPGKSSYNTSGEGGGQGEVEIEPTVLRVDSGVTTSLKAGQKELKWRTRHT